MTILSSDQNALFEPKPDPYEGWLDRSFDHHFDALRGWLPWVGARFRDQSVRTLILGESVYDYSETASGHERIKQNDHLRHMHLRHAIKAKKKLPFVRNFERAFYLKRHPSAQERQDLWSGVAYHNLVLRMLRSRKARPSDEDYAEGWQHFIELCRCLGVQQVIVYGLEKRKIDALRSLARTQSLVLADARPLKPVGLSVEIGSGREMRMVFIRHPSSYFSWKAWGKVVQHFVQSQGASADVRLADLRR